MFDRITFDHQIMGGRACIRGMRIPVSVIVSQIAHGATFDEILEGYPDLEKDDIQQAVEYAAWLTQEEIHLRRDRQVRFIADMCMAGRYLIVFFVRKKTGQALPISARDMTSGERRRYAKK
jgi:uncharacterized protein (DUF433 family)